MKSKFNLLTLSLFLSLLVFPAETEAQVIIRSSEPIDLPGSMLVRDSITDAFYYHSSRLKNDVELKSLMVDYGYLECDIRMDSSEMAGGWLDVVPGGQYTWASLRIPETEGVDHSDLMEDFLAGSLGRPVSISGLHSLRLRVIENYANAGYPYVELFMDSLTVVNRQLSASLNVTPGERVVVDSLIVQSDRPINPRILSRVMRIQKGDWYRARDLIRAHESLQYYGMASPGDFPEAGFFGSKAWVYVRPIKPKTNRIDGMVGFLPVAGTGVPRLSGEFNLLLNNAFHQLESFKVNWRSPAGGSQKLEAGLNYPYLFATPFGIASTLDLYRKDTAYLLLGANAGIRYTNHPGSHAELFYRIRQSRNLGSAQTGGLPVYDLQMTGVSWRIDRRNRMIHPFGGWMLEQSAAFGIKSTEGGISDAETLQTSYWELDLQGEAYVRLSGAWLLFFKGNGGYRSGNLSENESYRLGGYSSLRGYQEEQFYTSAFVTGSVEVRYMLGEAAHVHIFLDGGWIAPDLWPVAPGIGLSLETQAGILGLDYGMGQIIGEPFTLRTGLIHLGIQTNF